MYKETFTYEDFNGLERTEDFYFNLSEAELLEMNTSYEGGLMTMLNKIVAAQDGPTIMKWFKKILLAAYGEKSEDGRYFDKSAEIKHRFEHTPVYSIMYTKLATDDEYAAKFMNSIVPTPKDNKGKPALKEIPANN
jgi:hypothetical protein